MKGKGHCKLVHESNDKKELDVESKLFKQEQDFALGGAAKCPGKFIWEQDLSLGQ